MLFSKLFKSEQKPTDAADRVAARKGRASSEKTQQRRVKVSVKDLRIGMVVVRLDKPWEESSFPFQRVEIKSAADIEAVTKECSSVLVEFDENNFPRARKPAPEAQRRRPSNVNTLNVSEEIGTATNVQGMANQAVSSLFNDISCGVEPDAAIVKEAVSGCVESILRNQDATLWLTRMQAKDNCTAQHSMNVSALSIIMAKSMGLNNREMEDVGVCGMLHDVGKTRISTELLEKKATLSPDDVLELQRHTVYGRDILLSTKNVMSGAADVAYSHHEQPDGQGYPRGLVDDQIPLFSKIVAIAEAYDNITSSSRPDRSARSTLQALQVLYSQRGKQFDSDIVVLFIDSVGIFPPGSIVEMVNKEIGIVLANTKDKLRPRVIMILDPNGEPAMQRIIDLSRHESDTQGNTYQIKTTHSDGAFGINVEEFQRAGLRIG